MKKIKAKVPKGLVSIEVRSSMYDPNESLFMELMMTQKQFSGMVQYLVTNSAPRRNKKS